MAKPTILIVDDSSLTVAFYSEVFASRGFEVVAASDGLEAIEQFYQRSPDVVLLDVDIPKMNGFLVCRLIKEDPAKCHIPVVMLTSLVQKGYRFWGSQSGADGYVGKDEPPEKILEAVCECLAELERPELEPSSEELGGEVNVLERLGQLLDRKLFESTLLADLATIGGTVFEIPDILSRFAELMEYVTPFELMAVKIRHEATPMLFVYSPFAIQEAYRSRYREEALALISKQVQLDSVEERAVFGGDREPELPMGPLRVIYSNELVCRMRSVGRLYLFSNKRPVAVEESVNLLGRLTEALSLFLHNALLFRNLESSKHELSSTVRQLKSTQQELRLYAKSLEEITAQRTSQLQVLEQELVEHSSKAGVAEIASGVMHNLGNIAQVLKTRSHEVERLLEGLKPEYHRKVLSLLESRRGNLDRYLATDEQGKQLFGYMERLISEQERVYREVLGNLQTLKHKHSQMSELISLQQRYGGVSEPMQLVDLCAVVIDVVEMYREALNRRGIQLDTEFPRLPPMALPKNNLAMVFMNLLKNAIEAIDQFTDSRPKRILIRLTRTSEKVTLEIADSGIGIPVDHVERVFEFGHTSKGTAGGKGFGLYICRAIVHYIGGDLTAASPSELGGAKFDMTLPLRRRSGSE